MMMKHQNGGEESRKQSGLIHSFRFESTQIDDSDQCSAETPWRSRHVYCPPGKTKIDLYKTGSLLQTLRDGSSTLITVLGILNSARSKQQNIPSGFAFCRKLATICIFPWWSRKQYCVMVIMTALGIGNFYIMYAKVCRKITGKRLNASWVLKKRHNLFYNISWLQATGTWYGRYCFR